MAFIKKIYNTTVNFYNSGTINVNDNQVIVSGKPGKNLIGKDTNSQNQLEEGTPEYYKSLGLNDFGV